MTAIKITHVNKRIRIGRFFIGASAVKRSVTLNLLQSGMGSKMKSGNTIRCHHFSKYVLVTLFHQNKTGLTRYKKTYPQYNFFSNECNPWTPPSPRAEADLFSNFNSPQFSF